MLRSHNIFMRVRRLVKKLILENTSTLSLFLENTYTLGPCVPERVAPAVLRFPQRGKLPREQPVWFLLLRYSTGTQSTSGNRFFALAVF
jgi:hypothetical protein